MSHSNANNAHLLKGAAISGIINGIINAIINWFTIDKSATINLTADSITSGEHTVFAGAVTLAVSLAFILTSIAYFTTKIPNKQPYFPAVFKLAIKHCVLAFGVVVIVAILLQKIAGTVAVSPLTSAVVTGIIAAVVGLLVEYETKKSLLIK